jgi:hypothetical protein
MRGRQDCRDKMVGKGIWEKGQEEVKVQKG